MNVYLILSARAAEFSRLFHKTNLSLLSFEPELLRLTVALTNEELKELGVDLSKKLRADDCKAAFLIVRTEDGDDFEMMLPEHSNQISNYMPVTSEKLKMRILQHPLVAKHLR